MPEKLSQLRQKLNAKAKQEPKYRFYTLYGRIFRRDTLENGMETGESQQGIARSGRRDDQDDRRKRRRSFTISRRNRAVAAAENLPAATSTAGMDRESEWKVEATGHPDDTRSGSADGHVPDRGTDIRGGLSGV